MVMEVRVLVELPRSAPACLTSPEGSKLRTPVEPLQSIWPHASDLQPGTREKSATLAVPPATLMVILAGVVRYSSAPTSATANSIQSAGMGCAKVQRKV